MKKVLFPILALVLALGLALPAAAHTEDDPDVTQLIAGQHTDVGEVQVWNDGDNLYVKYVVDAEGWCLTETHLHVATSLEDIPQTEATGKGKNTGGNPIPGQFEWQEEHDPPVAEYTYEIPLDGWTADTLLYIAAHADVVQPTDEWETVWQIGDVETVGCPTETPVLLTNYADEFNWTNATICGAGDRLRDVQPVYTNPFVVGTTATSAFPYASNYKYSYATDIDVEWYGALTFGGKLTISWTPGASGSETKEVSGDGITTATFNANGSPAPGQGWFLDKFALVENTVDVDPLTSGTHTITFKDINLAGDGTIWDWIRLEKPCEEDETAWGAGVDFPGRNWATYFEYHVQYGPTCMELRENPPFKDVPDAGEDVAGSVCLYGDSANDELDVEVNLDDGDASATYGVYLESYDGTTGGSAHWLSWERLGYLTTDAGGVGSFSTSKSRSPGTYYYQIVLSKTGAWGSEAFGTDIVEIVIN